MRNLLSLPAELLTSILSYLDSNSLLNCAAAAKHLSRLISDSSKLQYTISLAKHRLLDILPTSTNPPYATRLKILRDRERAWRDLSWKGRHTLQLPPTGSVYEFVGGIYGNGREDENRVTASISFLELPSSDPVHLELPKRNLRTWTHSMGDVAIIDFTMDPSQNLLVLVALAPADSKYLYNLHLRTISTNEPHPKAPLPILSCLERHPTIPPPPELFAAVRVQVSGDLVGLLIKEAPDPVGAHLEIWNWENDPYYPCSMSSQHGIDDFTFLSHSSFLVVLPVGRFEVYTFSDPLTAPIFPSSSSTSSLPKTGCQPIRKYSYDFPPLSNGYMYWYISMSCNPAPGYVPSQGRRAMNPFPSQQTPFSTYSDSSSTSRESSGDNNDNTSPSSRSSDKTNGTTKQMYYPLPDERIHACCIYIFNPNNHTHVATATNAIPTNGNAPATHGNTNANGNNANNSNSTTDDDLDDDDLDEDNQQVHSFVFFLNLKTLLDPPEEWFRSPEKVDSTNTFAALASKLGPLWKSSSSPTLAPATLFPSPSARVPLTLTPTAATSAAMLLESSLNALKRRQEEKELRDAKDVSAGGSGKRKKGGSVSASSSLSIEIPINGGVTSENGSGNVPVPVLGTNTSTPTLTPISSPVLTTAQASSSGTVASSSNTASACPPFPQFNSSYTLANGSGSTNTTPYYRYWPMTQSTGSSNTATDQGATAAVSTRMTSPISPSDLRTTIFSSNGTRPALGVSPVSIAPSFSIESSLSSSSAGSHPPSSSSPGSTTTTTSPCKTRSSSTPPSSSYTSSTSTYTHAHSSTQLNSRSTTPSSPPPIYIHHNHHIYNHHHHHHYHGNHNNSNNTHHRSSSSYSPPHHNQPIPWDVWGPSSTRWFEECLSTDWQHAIYGLRTVESVSARERERLAAKLKAQREKQKQKEALRQVGKEGQMNGVLNGKGKEKMEEGVRLNRKGKGKEKEVVVVVGGECGDESKAKLKRATPPMNQGKRGTNIGVQVKSGETQPESEVEVEPGNKSSLASNDILGAVEVPDEEQGNLSQLEALATNAADTNGTSNTSPDPSSSSSSSSPSVNGAEYANGQPTQTTLVSALPVRRKPRRFLRVRDFNPYSLKLVEAEAQSQALTVPRSGENGTSNHRNRNNGKGKQHAFASSPSPPPYSYSYPYPIHLSVNLNLQHLNGFASTGYPPPTSLVPGTLSFPDSSTPMNGGGTNNTNIWGKRRVVREPSITPVKGVFKKDIVSWLPYTEVVSEETFEVTDVMMDDCRLLLLKRGQMGKLESVEVLMM